MAAHDDFADVSDNGMKRGQEDTGNDVNSKKRVTEQAPPSRVLHIRGLSPDVQEADIVALAQPFGRVVGVLILKKAGPMIQKLQAFVEMDDVTAAAALIQYYSGLQASIRNKPVFFQFSNRESISNNQPPSEGSGAILHVTVQNLLYPITLDVFQQLFSKYGQVTKIVTFTKNNNFQALIKFDQPTSAAAAKTALDNQNVYYGCCTLKIVFSTLSDVTVRFNNDKSRDYLDPTLPSAPGMPTLNDPSAPGGMAGMAGLVGQQPMMGAGGQWGHSQQGVGVGMGQGFGGASGFGAMQAAAAAGAGGASPVVIVAGFNADTTQPDQLFTLFGLYGDVQRVKILYNKKNTALIMLGSPSQALTAVQHLNGCVMPGGGQLQVNVSKHTTISMPRSDTPESAHLTKDYSNSPLHRFKNNQKALANITAPSPTVHVSNLPAGTTEDILRDLFAVHGQVVNVRFLAKDPRMALVEMTTVPEAISAILTLHQLRVGENALRLAFSKNMRISHA